MHPFTFSWPGFFLAPKQPARQDGDKYGGGYRDLNVWEAGHVLGSFHGQIIMCVGCDTENARFNWLAISGTSHNSSTGNSMWRVGRR